LFLLPNISRDMTGWECVEPAEVGVDEFEPTICEFLQPGETRLGGEEMVKRARQQSINNSGLRHAEAMLREQDKIPTEWRKYCLVFPEVWQSLSGHRGVFYLYWGGNRWSLDCYWLDDDFDSYCRLVRPASNLQVVLGLFGTFVLFLNAWFLGTTDTTKPLNTMCKEGFFFYIIYGGPSSTTINFLI
jgi:hypothetical protein